MKDKIEQLPLTSWKVGAFGMDVVENKPLGETIADCCMPRLDADQIRLHAALIAHAPEMFGLLEAVLLFHGAGPWDLDKRLAWNNRTGCQDATTKALCDRIRLTLARARNNREEVFELEHGYPLKTGRTE